MDYTTFLPFLLLLLLLLIHYSAARAPIGIGGNANGDKESAYTALQAWKSAITDDPSKILDTWVGPNVCTYTGVFCAANPQDDKSVPVVVGIDLNHANLRGTLVKELSLLREMSLLHLNTNRFTGTIPETFEDLTNLQELDLSNNKLSGPFPEVVLGMPNLAFLDIRFNALTGRIPAELFTNMKLDAIFLNNNKFEGEIPESFGYSLASVISLANNNLSGEIPATIGSNSISNFKMNEVLLLNNKLTGCIPQGVGLLTGIQVLDVSMNNLAGQLPESISCLGGIEVLNVARNRLSGELSDVICSSLKRIVNLNVANNFFSGISQQCTKLSNASFGFSDNCVPGWDMQRPQPECSTILGGSWSCLRTPVPLVCSSTYS